MVGTAVESTSQLASAAGELVLRVCGPSRRGQVVRLRSTKCTVGSQPGCTLRLRGPQIAPVHCLILRGPGGVVVRRWAADTRLNGRAFTDAELRAGDCLAAGPVELEVLETGQPFRPTPSQGAADLESPAPAPPAAQRQQAAEWKRQEQMLAERAQQIQQETAALEAERQRFQQQRQQSDAEQADLAAGLAERSEQLDGYCRQLDDACRQLDQQRQEWLAERTRQQEELDRRAAAAEKAEAELKARQEQFPRLQPGLPAEDRSEAEGAGLPSDGPAPSAEPVEFQRPSAEAPVDLAAVFRKIGAAGVLDEDEPEPRDPRGQPAPKKALAEPPATDSAATIPNEPDDNESIDQYMVKLMGRVRAGVAASASPSAPQPPANFRPPTAAVEAEPAGAADPLLPQPPEPPKRRPGEMVPLAAAPEKQGGLSAMRELANLSAQTALGTHAGKQWKRARRTKAVVALLGLAFGAALTWMWWAKGASDLAFYAALVSLFVALVWGIQCALLTGRLIVSKTGHIQWAPSDRGDAQKPEQDRDQLPPEGSPPAAVAS